MSRSVYDRPPLPDWMRGQVSLRQSDRRWFRPAGPGAIDLRAIERDLLLTGRLPAERLIPPPPGLTREQQSCGGRARMATLSPNERRKIAAAGGRAYWEGKSETERKAVGARLAEARRQRVRLLPASLVDGLVLDASRRHPCERCGHPATSYVRQLDAAPGTPMLWRCARHAFRRRGDA
jgi:hypothetical protein